MRKKISREQIVETTLELIRDENDFKDVNLRGIARVLGCAHTNLYNYFPSYTGLLWETHVALQELFLKTLEGELLKVKDPNMKIRCFFNTFVEMYLSNRGWFRLAWTEYISETRPERDVIVTENTFIQLNKYISDIWKELKGVYPSEALVSRAVHNIHCYIVGEVSNYISGRRFIEGEEDLNKYIVNEAINMLSLYLRG